MTVTMESPIDLCPLGAQPIPDFSDDYAMNDLLDLEASVSQDSPPTPPSSPITVVNPIVEGATTTSPTGKAKHERKFRLHAKAIFATWPQCSKPKNQILTLIKQLPNYDWCIVCEEKHEDGSDHRHAIIVFKKKLNIKDPKHFDFLTDTHGHYEGVKNLRSCVEYVTKDSQYVCDNCDVDLLLKKPTVSKSTSIANEIMNGKTALDIMTMEPGFYLLHSKQVKEFAHEWSEAQQESTLLGWQEIPITLNGYQDHISIVRWLNLNVKRALEKTRTLGMKQLFLWGKTQLGKSTMAMKIATMVKTFFATSSEHFFNGLNDTYVVVVFDEFHGQQTITYMNQFVDGQQMVVPQKGTQYYKKANPAVIILSNYPPQRCYPKIYEENREHFDAFVRRFDVIEVTHPLFALL